MHIEVDKMGEKVTSGDSSGVAASECVLAVLKALSVFEGGYFLPQAGDSSFVPAVSSCPFVADLNESFVFTVCVPLDRE